MRWRSSPLSFAIYDPAMGQAGDVFEMPDGSQYILRTPTAATKGDYVEFEFVFPAGTFAPPPHLHPSQVEEYEVLEGEFNVLVGNEWRRLRTGESASVTFGRPKQSVRVRNFHRPARSGGASLGDEAWLGPEWAGVDSNHLESSRTRA